MLAGSVLLHVSPALAADVTHEAGTAKCGQIADGLGGTVSVRDGRSSITTRLGKACEPPPVGPPPKAVAARPVVKPGPDARAAAPIEPEAPPAVLAGPANLPPDTEQPPSALRGDLVRAGATVITGGAMLWLLHSSLWTSLLLLGVPIWRHVDLLPVVQHASLSGADASGSRDGEDAAVASVLDGAAGASAERGRG